MSTSMFRLKQTFRINPFIDKISNFQSHPKLFALMMVNDFHWLNLQIPNQKFSFFFIKLIRRVCWREYNEIVWLFFWRCAFGVYKRIFFLIPFCCAFYRFFVKVTRVIFIFYVTKKLLTFYNFWRTIGVALFLYIYLCWWIFFWYFTFLLLFFAIPYYLLSPPCLWKKIYKICRVEGMNLMIFCIKLDSLGTFGQQFFAQYINNIIYFVHIRGIVSVCLSRWI